MHVYFSTSLFAALNLNNEQRNQFVKDADESGSIMELRHLDDLQSFYTIVEEGSPDRFVYLCWKRYKEEGRPDFFSLLHWEEVSADFMLDKVNAAKRGGFKVFFPGETVEPVRMGYSEDQNIIL